MVLLICGSTAAHDAARMDVNDVCPLLEVDGAVDVAVVEVFERGGSPSEAILLSERIVRVAVYSKLTLFCTLRYRRLSVAHLVSHCTPLHRSLPYIIAYPSHVHRRLHVAGIRHSVG